MTTEPTPAPDRSRGRLLLLSGLGLAVLGVVGYIAQLRLRRLDFPWYMPAFAVLGVVLLGISLARRRTAVRIAALVFVTLLAAFELASLYGMRQPPYSGPLAVGRPMPAFEAKRADGPNFTRESLIGDKDHVLVFFRGRW
jgi:hypothetical protein